MKKPSLSYLALCAACIGCSTSAPPTQVITGQLSARDAVAVRATSGRDVVAAAEVRSNGAFTLALPVGGRYSIDVLTHDGVKHLFANGGYTFRVCAPGAPWNLGTVQTPPGGSSPGSDPCGDDPTCGRDAPPPCSDPSDPATCSDPCGDDPTSCGCPTTDPTCWGDPCVSVPGQSACPGTPIDPSGPVDPGGPNVPVPVDGGATWTPSQPPVDFGCVEPQ